MGLETGTYISDLVATNPVNATDVVGEGDDHLRLIKSTILNTFPSVTGEVSLTHTQLNNTVIKDERNTLTATISGLLYPLKFQGNLPGYAMEESDAALDEKFWDFVCTAGDLVYRTRTDANGAGETFFQVKRTGTVVDEMDFSATYVDINGIFRLVNSGTEYVIFEDNATDLIIQAVGKNYTRFRDFGVGVIFEDGANIRMYDAANADYLSMGHSGSNAYIQTLGTGVPGNIQVLADGGSGSIQGISGTGFQWFDSANLHNVKISHDGTDLNVIASASTVGLDFQDFDNMRFMDGVQLRQQGGGSYRIYDSIDTGYMDFSHDGTDVNFDFATTTDINWNNGVKHKFQDGGASVWYASGGGAAVQMSHDGTDFIVQDITSTTDIRFTGLDYDFSSGVVTTSNASAAEVGYKGVPQNIQNGNYTLVLTDTGKQIYKASGGAGETITIPANSSVAFPIGTIIEIVNDGTGDLSIAITTDTLEEIGSGSTGTRTLADNGKAVIEKVTATLWKISGIGVT